MPRRTAIRLALSLTVVAFVGVLGVHTQRQQAARHPAVACVQRNTANHLVWLAVGDPGPFVPAVCG